MTILPSRNRGHQSDAAKIRYEAELKEFCDLILQINTTLDFRAAARDWCYMLEPYRLGKDEFDACAAVIRNCRKSGMLPLEIVRDDTRRSFTDAIFIDDTSPEEEFERFVAGAKLFSEHYNPVPFWDYQDTFLMMLVEKSALYELFKPICDQFHIQIANAGGWTELNQRAYAMRQFEQHEAEGRDIVLLYCGDHDPHGLLISDKIKKNMRDMFGAVRWSPDDLVIDRFGLNYDFIERHDLTWIDGLMTGGGKDLANARHPDHKKPYVQDYLAKFGTRKVEANALVVNPDAGRELCRETIAKYIYRSGVEQWRHETDGRRLIVKSKINELVGAGR